MKKIFTTICSLLASLTLLFGQQNYVPNVTVSTFACNTPILNHPNGVAVDSKGNVYVADAGNNLIRKITPVGPASILAGNTMIGSTDGQGSLASFNNPTGIAVDDIGNVYVADAGNHKIRKITPSGLVSTLAGSTIGGSDDGQGSFASFYNPAGVAVDSIGNVYVADSYNNNIRKITPSGLVSTLAGYGGYFGYGSTDGQGSLAKFNGPSGVAVDKNGNVYVSDKVNGLIRKITPGGLVSTLAGTKAVTNASDTADGQGSLARFNYPSGVAVDGFGNVYVADSYNNKIRKITPGGLVSSIAGSTIRGSADGQGNLASFNSPTGIAVDVNGNVYVAEKINDLIRKITPTGLVSTIAGLSYNSSADGKGGVARFNSPSGVAVDKNGNVYVSDAGNSEIRKITPDGFISTFAGSTTMGTADGQGSFASFNSPGGIALDGLGNLYVADGYSNNIRKITPDGLVSTLAGSTKKGFSDGQGSLASFYVPCGVDVDGNGNLYVADANNLIRKITPGGLVTTLAGSYITNISAGSADGQGSLARFNRPSGVAVDGIGNVYVADFLNHNIRKITPGGLVSTLAGSTTKGFTDGQGNLARFNNPTEVALDGVGNVYVADAGNNVIRKITPSGLVSTLAGSGVQGFAEGQGSLASFNYPTGIAVDENGYVYVSDNINNAIRKITIGQTAPNDNPKKYKSLNNNELVIDTVFNYQRGRDIGSTCTTSFANSNVIDAYYSFKAVTSTDSIILNVTNPDWVSSMELIDTLLYTSISDECINNIGTGLSQRTYIFNNLTVGENYLVRVEIGATSPLGYARTASLSNTFSVQLLQTVTGIYNNKSASFINIYPNPGQNTLNIALSEEENGTISLVDVQGNTVLAQSINGKIAQLNTSNIANGVYVLKVLSENASFTKQVIISK